VVRREDVTLVGKTKKFIQVGVGGHGAAWVSKFMPRLVKELKLAEPAAVVDINPDAFALPREVYGLPEGKCYTDIQKALDENPADFVIVVVPPAFHEQVVDQALAHDLHVLSEKPIADTPEATARIYQKVKAAGKKMAVTMSHRFDQDKQSLEHLIKSGEYGRLNCIIGRNTWDNRKFASWGKFRHEIPDTLLVEGTVHHFDIIRALAGADAETVYAVTWNPPWGEFAGDSNALVTIQMQNGVKAVYEGNKTSATRLNGWGNDYFRAECENATIVLDSRRLTVMSDLSGERHIVEKPLLQRDAWTNAWIAEMYVAWLAGGAPPPCHLEDNLQCSALLFAAIESAHTNRPVDVQDFLAKRLKSQQAACAAGGLLCRGKQNAQGIALCT